MGGFIAGLPKAELHLHLEGTLGPEMMLQLAERNGVDIPYDTTDAINAALAGRPAGLVGFLDHHYMRIPLLQTKQDFQDVTLDLMRKCNENVIRYAEIFFDPQVHTSRGVSFETVIDGIEEGRRLGAEAFNVKVNLIMCLNRERSVESALEMLDQARPHRDRIIGFGMDSYEEGNPPRKFAEVYARARDEGYRLTAHCDVDQANSVQHIWECLDVLGVDRIDHGLNAIEDPELVEELKRRRVPLTACPIRRAHDPGPQDVDRVRGLFDAGVMVTLNTDDPAEFDTGYLVNLLREVQEASGYSEQDLVRFMTNAFEATWLEPAERDAYVESVIGYAAGFGVPVGQESG